VVYHQGFYLSASLVIAWLTFLDTGLRLSQLVHSILPLISPGMLLAIALKSFGYGLILISFNLSRLHPSNSPSDCSSLLAYRLNMLSGIWLGPLIFISTFLFILTLPHVSWDSITLQMLLLDYSALSAGYMFFTALKIIANLRYCFTLLSWYWFQSKTNSPHTLSHYSRHGFT
jgi:hypothetical protein